jgi:lipid A ethanolaminephosphotransferase
MTRSIVRLTKETNSMVMAIKNWQPKANIFAFVFSISTLNALLFQKPLLDFAIPASNSSGWQGWLQLLSLQIVQIFLLVIFLFLISFVSIRLLKIFVTALLIINACAVYFMLSYNMELDRTMIANIFNTDSREVFGLWHYTLVPYIVVLGLIPSVIVWWTHVQISKRYWRLLAAVLSFVTLAVWLFLTSTTWLWYDQHASRLGSKVLPWSYIVNTARYFNQFSMEQRVQVLLPSASFEIPTPKRKEIVVLVIGEAARAQNFSMYGYAKDTNPYTAQTSLVALPVGNSCATNTISSTACILTHEGKDAPSHTKFEPLPSYMTRHGIETIYRTNNWGPPPITVNTYQTAIEIAQQCTMDPCPSLKLDEALNWGLSDALRNSTSKRIFVTLHQSGSHGPTYYLKYPKKFATFKPECKTVQVSNCSQDELANAYDNSIRYTNFLLADLISQLQSVDADSVMIYVSDHGQSLGENGIYLHGMPNAIAPKQQREIPFLVWMSDGFKETHALTEEDIIPKKTFPHDFPFHSVMGAFGMRSDIYKPEFDIFNLHK